MLRVQIYDAHMRGFDGLTFSREEEPYFGDFLNFLLNSHRQTWVALCQGLLQESLFLPYPSPDDTPHNTQVGLWDYHSM